MSIFNLFNKGVNFNEGVELAKNSDCLLYTSRCV